MLNFNKNRLYTQNIDGLERLSGIDHKKLIEAHGNFRTARCIRCKTNYSGLYVKVRKFIKVKIYKKIL
jgi:NAD-dependent SIR2 family protein deacetylase